jgi:hypothetical protein
VEAHRNTLQTLFQVQSRLVAPLYQRPYVWSESEWDSLWHAISWTADKQLSGQHARSYFLGAMVLDQIRVPSGHIAARQIIDGQQRLLTLQLCLAALRDLCSDPPLSAYGELLRRMTVNDAPNLSTQNRFKVWPTNVDREVFERVMTAGTGALVRALKKDIPAERQRMLRAYIYFEERALEWLREPDVEPAKRITALWSTLSELIVIVTIDLDAEDDAQQIFETLNALGLKLLPADLVKNYLLRSAEAQGLDTADLYERYWREFDVDEAYWRKEIRQGRLTRPRIDIFLQHFVTLRTQSDVLASNLFGVFRDAAVASGKAVPEQLADFQRYARTFRRWDDPAGPHAEFFRALTELDTTTMFPVLLELFQQHATSDDELARCIAHLESYLIRRTVSGLTAKAYNRIFVALLKNLTDAKDFTANKVAALLLEEVGESSRWPTDEEFEYKWLTEPLYKKQKQGRIRLLLERLELRMRSKKSEQIVFGQPLTIEHLMPQEWPPHWQLPIGEDPISAKMRRDAAVQTIGNLTLVTQPLNSGVSNGPWTTKRPEIEKYSLLKMNEGWPLDWDELSIEARGRKLFALALELWPRPAGPHDEKLWRNPNLSLGGTGEDWRRPETVLAYELLKSSDSFPNEAAIAELAALIGRTNGSIGRKLHNLRSAESGGVKGLPHKSKFDDDVVREFRGDLRKLHAAAAEIRATLAG